MRELKISTCVSGMKLPSGLASTRGERESARVACCGSSSRQIYWPTSRGGVPLRLFKGSFFAGPLHSPSTQASPRSRSALRRCTCIPLLLQALPNAAHGAANHSKCFTEASNQGTKGTTAATRRQHGEMGNHAKAKRKRIEHLPKMKRTPPPHPSSLLAAVHPRKR